MARHKKFSSVGINLTDDVNNGELYRTDKRRIDAIAIHCSFSPQYRGDGAIDIDAWHKNRWGSGCGYHYVILEDGTIQKGRWVDYAGAGVKGQNKHTIQVCRIGGMDAGGKAIRDASLKQEKAIRKIAKLLANMYDLSMDKVLGHNEFPNVNKSCPLLDMGKIRNGI